MLKKDWKKELKKLFASKGIDASKVGITPYRDWRTVVAVFFVALSASIGFNVYMFIEINQGGFFTNTPKGIDGVKFDRDGLARVLDELVAREAIFEKLKTESVPVIDPSI